MYVQMEQRAPRALQAIQKLAPHALVAQEIVMYAVLQAFALHVAQVGIYTITGVSTLVQQQHIFLVQFVRHVQVTVTLAAMGAHAQLAAQASGNTIINAITLAQ